MKTLSGCSARNLQELELLVREVERPAGHRHRVRVQSKTSGPRRTTVSVELPARRRSIATRTRSPPGGARVQEVVGEGLPRKRSRSRRSTTTVGTAWSRSRTARSTACPRPGCRRRRGGPRAEAPAPRAPRRPRALRSSGRAAARRGREAPRRGEVREQHVQAHGTLQGTIGCARPWTCDDASARLFAALRDEAKCIGGRGRGSDRRGARRPRPPAGERFAAIAAAGPLVVNGERAHRDTPVVDGDDVALLPPVSGG